MTRTLLIVDMRRWVGSGVVWPSAGRCFSSISMLLSGLTGTSAAALSRAAVHGRGRAGNAAAMLQCDRAMLEVLTTLAPASLHVATQGAVRFSPTHLNAEAAFISVAAVSSVETAAPDPLCCSGSQKKGGATTSLVLPPKDVVARG